ncbi:hypothetical protein B0H14DRAFT_3507667 [Mycena olivaceomarginata]|nr:hypothetical protein B0H14DRAFT_3507667 [Mycena olivaceomarginata]
MATQFARSLIVIIFHPTHPLTTTDTATHTSLSLSLSLPLPTNSAVASTAATIITNKELSLPTWVILIIIVTHGHNTDKTSDNEDDYVEEVAPPYEEILLIVIQAPDPSYSPTGHCPVSVTQTFHSDPVI